MPRIPVYTQQVTPSAAAASPRLTPGSAVGQGLEALGRTGAQIAQQQAESNGRIWASSEAAKASTKMFETFEAQKQAAKPGADGFTDGFMKQYDDYVKELSASAPSAYARDLFSAQMNNDRETFAKHSLTWEAGERARFSGQQIDEGVQASAKIVYAMPDKFEDEMGRWGLTIGTAPIDEAGKSKLAEIARTNLAWSAETGLIDKDPVAYLGKTENERGISWRLLDLESQKKAIAYAERKVAETRQDAEVGLHYETQDAKAMARTGTAPSGPPRKKEDFLAVYSNKRVAEHEWSQYITARQTGSAVSSMQGMRTEDLLKIANSKPKKGKDFAVTAENHQIRVSAAAGIVRARAEDPVGYALKAGDFKFSPLNPQDQAGFAAELKRRSAALPVMAKKYGRAAVMSKDEAQVVAQNIDLLPADSKVAMLESIRNGVSDDAVYSSVLNSLRPDSPATALVGNIAAVGFKKNALMIAKGEDLLNPSKAGRSADGKGSGAAFPMPQESLLRDKWVKTVGDAYREFPDAEAAAYQAYRAYYAASAGKKGLNDPKAAPDSKIVDEAIAAATGGIARWKTDWFGNSTPSANIVLPYGMAEDKFHDRVSAEWLKVRGAAGYTKTDVGDIGLQNTGANGEYVVMSGSSWLPDKDGKPIILRIK